LLLFSSCSPEEIILAQYKLKTEQINLMEATRLAELLSSSSDAFKVMLDEQRRRSEALKAMSKYRLLWISAIDKVLRQNFIEKVRARLLHSSIADWYRKMVEPDSFAIARIEAARQNLRTETKSRKKHLRRSLDNSELLPGLNPNANEKISPGLPSYAATKLPEINNHPRDVNKSSAVEGTPRVVRRSGGTRRTFDVSEHKASSTTPHIVFDPDAVPPSITQSFVDAVSKSLVPLMLSVVDDDDLSVATLKHRNEKKKTSRKTRRARM
jgi:hypothetical protein